MDKVDFTAAFASDLLQQGITAVPVLLLENYRSLDLSEKELVLILELWTSHNQPGGNLLIADVLAGIMELPVAEIEALIAALVQKRYLKIDDDPVQGRSYSLAPIFDHLSELWAQKRISIASETTKPSRPTELISLFEQEFGRPLTPMETTQIQDWRTEDQLPDSLIKEALKISVLRGILNFRYIDSILRDWRKKGIKSVKDLDRLKGRPREKNSSLVKTSRQATSKFADIYLNQR